MTKAMEAFKALKALKCYDIAPHFHQNMPSYPSSPNLWIIPDAQTIKENGFYSQILVIGEHVGSHIDSPMHTVPGARAIDAFEGDYFIAPYKKYAFDEFYDLKPGDMMTMEQVRKIEMEHGISPEEGDIILLQFGWHIYYKPDAPTKAERDWYAINSTGLTDEVMDYFASKKIKAIGCDNANFEGGLVNGVPQTFNGHIKYFHPNDIPIMENFADMTAAPPEGLFVAIPLPIDKGSGSPVRPLLFG